MPSNASSIRCQPANNTHPMPGKTPNMAPKPSTLPARRTPHPPSMPLTPSECRKCLACCCSMRVPSTQLCSPPLAPLPPNRHTALKPPYKCSPNSSTIAPCTPMPFSTLLPVTWCSTLKAMLPTLQNPRPDPVLPVTTISATGPLIPRSPHDPPIPHHQPMAPLMSSAKFYMKSFPVPPRLNLLPSSTMAKKPAPSGQLSSN